MTDVTEQCPGCKSPEIQRPSWAASWMWYNPRSEDEPRPVKFCPMCGEHLHVQEEEKSSDNPNMPRADNLTRTGV